MPARSEAGPSRLFATQATHAADPSTSAEGFVAAGDGRDWLVYGQGIERSANDDRDYRCALLRADRSPIAPTPPAALALRRRWQQLTLASLIRLRNGLEALVISDPATDKSAAALTVRVGHLSDPVRPSLH